MRRDQGRGRVHGQGTSEHSTADEDGAGRTTSRLCRWYEGTQENCAERYRKIAQAEDAADRDRQ